jgi:large subunit ribosomal protein L9
LKVILTQYQEKLGDVGDIVEVKAGYANNYLIPQEIAVVATKGNINQMELVKKAAIKVESKNIEEASKTAEGLADIILNFIVKTGEEGKLYGSITNKDLAAKIMEDKKVEIDRKKIDLPEHIKELGEYDVDIKLYKEVKTTIKVIVEPDEESKALIEAHQKEKEAADAEEMEKIDADIEAEAAKGKTQEARKEDTAGPETSETEETGPAPEAKEDEKKKTDKDKSDKKDK